MPRKHHPHPDQLELGLRQPKPAQQAPPFPPECEIHRVPKIFTATMTCRAGHVHRARKVYVWCPVFRKR
jgi:hypothetical protein